MIKPAKPKAVAKAKSKAKAKWKGKAKSTNKMSSSIIASPSANGSSNGRRSTPERAQRALEARVSPEQLAIIEKKKVHGLTINERVCEDLRKFGKTTASGKPRLSTKYWMDIFKDFDIGVGLSGFIDPPEEYSVDDITCELVEAIAMATGKNPALWSRGVDSMESFLGTADEISKLDVHAVLTTMGSPSATVTRQGADRVILALLLFWTRTLYHCMGVQLISELNN